MPTLQELLSRHTNSYSPLPPLQADNITLTASFVIPVFNSAASITACVQSIANQLRRDLVRQVILVNDGSTDDTPQIIEELQRNHANKLQIKIIHNTRRRFAAYARNRGIEASSGDVVCFIDSDIILPPNYLVEHLWRHQQVTNCITISLRQDICPEEVPKLTFPIAKTCEYRQAILETSDFLQTVPFQINQDYHLAEICLTCAVSYKRSDLVKVKGCPENFVGWGFNDTAMAAKVIALGRAVIPLTNCAVYHMAHAPRSGDKTKKWTEYEVNKRRYNVMLQLPFEQVLEYRIGALDLAT